MREYVLCVIGALVIMAAYAIPWGRIGGSSASPSKGTSRPYPPPLPDPETKIREAIERTKGDYTKLTSEEKGRLDELSAGHGHQYVTIQAGISVGRIGFPTKIERRHSSTFRPCLWQVAV